MAPLFQQPLFTFSNPSLNRVSNTFTDNFNSDVGWNIGGNGGNVDTGNSEYDYNINYSGTSDYGYLDVQNSSIFGSGNNFDDSLWALRHHQVNHSSETDNANFPIICVADTVLSSNFNTGDSVAVVKRITSGGSHHLDIISYNGGVSDNTTNNSWSWTTGTDYYIETRRKSSTVIGFSVSNGNEFDGDIVSEVTHTVASSVINFRYMGNQDWFSGSNTRTLIGTIQKLEMWRDSNP